MRKQLTILFFILASTQLWALDAPVLISPENHHDDAYTRQTFKWNSVSDAGSYQIEVDTTKKFNSPLLRSETWSATSTTTFSVKITDFYFHTHYYWRVRAISKTNQEVTSAWSEVWDMTTVSNTSLVSPNDQDETATYFPTQTLTWKNSRGCTAYTIEIDTVPTFDSPAKSRETWSHTATEDAERSCEVKNLYLGKMNYWRVKVYNQNDSSDWSQTYRFHTLSKAIANSPKNLTKGYTTQIFEWKYLKGLTNVIIELDTTERFNSPALQRVKSSGSSQSYCNTTISEMYFGKTYYWRVKAYHQKDTTDWSDVLRFTTYRSGSLTTTPADSAVEQPTSLNLYFIYNKGVSKYQMQLDTTPEFNSPALENRIEGASSETYAYGKYTDLLFGTKYYRRIRDCHEKDTSEWSETWSFTTYDWGNHGSSPADGATNISVTPKLYIEHTNYISTYFVQIDTALTFDSPIVREQKVASTADYPYWQVTDTLLYGTTYYWRVKDAHTKDTSNWSVAWAFTTTYQLPTPMLVSPANQTTAKNDEVVYFKWNTCGDATRYVYQLSDDGQFRTYLHQEVLTDTTTSLVPPSNSILYWRVQAINSKGRSPWSRVFGLGTTPSQPTGLNDQHNHNQIRKILINGHLYIIREDKRYDATGFTID